jgi:hypothetical protein
MNDHRYEEYSSSDALVNLDDVKTDRQAHSFIETDDNLLMIPLIHRQILQIFNCVKLKIYSIILQNMKPILC